MKNKLYLVVLGLLVLQSCIVKDDHTYSWFELSNKSGQTIKILPSGFSPDTLKLADGESKLFDRGGGRGINPGINYAFFADFKNPVTVMFGQSAVISHYNDTLAHDGKHYKLTHGRNFYNQSSYQKDIEALSKHSRKVTLRYVFTPQDYLDASK